MSTLAAENRRLVRLLRDAGDILRFAQIPEADEQAYQALKVQRAVERSLARADRTAKFFHTGGSAA